MQLSEETTTVLRNFSVIQPNLLIQDGSVVRTISKAKDIIAEATVKETFDQEFGIYDLKEFLNCVDLIGSNHQLEFGDKSVRISGGSNTLEYFYTDAEMLATVTKKIKMPSLDVQFTLTQATMDQIRKAATALGHNNLVIRNSDDGIILEVTDTTDESNKTINNFSLTLPSNESFTNVDFRFIISIDNLKLMSGDYEVSLSSKCISEFRSKSRDLTYWVALDKKSTYKES